MILEELTFGTFEEIGPNILEITIHEGVELTAAHIEQIETGLLERYHGLYGLLINRKYSYSHTHSSMQRVSELKNLGAIAILVYREHLMETAEIHQAYQDNIKAFDDREFALQWLKTALETAAENRAEAASSPAS